MAISFGTMDGFIYTDSEADTADGTFEIMMKRLSAMWNLLKLVNASPISMKTT